MSRKRKSTKEEHTDERNTMNGSINADSHNQSIASSSSAAADPNKRMKHEEKEERIVMNAGSDHPDDISSWSSSSFSSSSSFVGSTLSTESTPLTSSQLLSALKLFLSDSTITPSLNIPHIPTDLVNIIHAYADPNTKPIEIYIFCADIYYSYESAVQHVYDKWIKFMDNEYEYEDGSSSSEDEDDDEEYGGLEEEIEIKKKKITEKYEKLKYYNGTIEQENEFLKWIKEWIKIRTKTKEQFQKLKNTIKWRRFNQMTMEWDRIM